MTLGTLGAEYHVFSAHFCMFLLCRQRMKEFCALNHNSASGLRNRYTESLQLDLIPAGGFCHPPLIVESDDTLAA